MSLEREAAEWERVDALMKAAGGALPSNFSARCEEMLRATESMELAARSAILETSDYYRSLLLQIDGGGTSPQLLESLRRESEETSCELEFYRAAYELTCTLKHQVEAFCASAAPTLRNSAAISAATLTLQAASRAGSNPFVAIHKGDSPEANADEELEP